MKYTKFKLERLLLKWHVDIKIGYNSKKEICRYNLMQYMKDFYTENHKIVIEKLEFP